MTHCDFLNWCGDDNRVGKNGIQPCENWLRERAPKVYISGPMTGLPELNFPAFNQAADMLYKKGYRAANPAKLNPDPNTPWHDCMRRDLMALVTCDVLALLPGWERSKGAHLELHIAHRIGMEIWTDLSAVPKEIA